MSDVAWFVYAPQSRFLESKLDGSRCAASVHDTYGVGFHQCSRKPTTTLEGYEFCTYHANRIKEQLDLKPLVD